jgi:hypothetical protein
MDEMDWDWPCLPFRIRIESMTGVWMHSVGVAKEVNTADTFLWPRDLPAASLNVPYVDSPDDNDPLAWWEWCFIGAVIIAFVTCAALVVWGLWHW